MNGAGDSQTCRRGLSPSADSPPPCCRSSTRAPTARAPNQRNEKPNESAVLRDRLVAELEALQTADEAACWAHRCLPAKNTLTADDAGLVEAGFRAMLKAFGDGRPGEGLREAVQRQPGAQRSLPNSEAVAPTLAATGTAADADFVEASLRAKLAAFGDGRPAGGQREAVQNPPGAQLGHPTAVSVGPRNRNRPRPHCGQDHSPTRQGPPQVRFQAAVLGVRSRTVRCTSSSLCAAACVGSQG
jgi:hypothetical protein